jgi:ectoine hydroxylase-related dioxygenase (phytanoyl-CoA dioxygenase family)
MDHARDRIDELRSQGYCVLPQHFSRSLIDACRMAVWPALLAHIEQHEPNRGTHRHFFPMPFEAPCFAPDFFFDDTILTIVRGAMDDRIVADQWGCDVPLPGSGYQGVHVDYKRPLFGEAPDLALPPYMLVISFGLSRIAKDDGPIEIAPGTHLLARSEALRAVDTGEIRPQPVGLEIGDVLIRHPWALHRGSPNASTVPRALVTIRYVRRWYADDSREVNAVPLPVWNALTPGQQQLMRFPIARE